MKAQLRRIFGFILLPLESGDEIFEFKSSHRSILIAVSVLFACLASGVLVVAQGQDPGYLIPVVLFGGVGLIGLIVGLLGTDRAVAKIWGSR